MNFKKRIAFQRSGGFDLERCSVSIGAVFGCDRLGDPIRLARCSDLTPLANKCFSKLPIKALELRKARSMWEIQRIRLRAVFGFDWRGVRIRLARSSDLTWALDKRMLRASGLGFRFQVLAASFRLRLHAPGPGCRHRVCVRIRMKSACKLRAHISRNSL